MIVSAIKKKNSSDQIYKIWFVKIFRSNRLSAYYATTKTIVVVSFCMIFLFIAFFGCAGTKTASLEDNSTIKFSNYCDSCPQQHQKIRGVWDAKNRLNSYYGKNKFEHLRLYFSEEGAYIESYYPVRGLVKLSLVESERHSYGCSSMAFEFDPLDKGINLPKGYENIKAGLNLMSTGFVRIILPDSYRYNVTAIFYSNPTDVHGTRVTFERPDEAYLLGKSPSLKRMYYYKDWSTNKTKGSEASHRKELISTFKKLKKQYGFRCVSQQTFTVHDGSPISRIETINLSGPIAFIIFCPNAGSEFSYFLNDTNMKNRTHLDDSIGYPTIVYGDQWSRPRQYTIHFQHRPYNIDSTEVHPPVDVTIFLLSQTPGDMSYTPCEPEFRSSFIAPELKVFLALITDKVHQLEYAKKYKLVEFLSGLGRNELMSQGLTELFPELSSFEIDLLGRKIIAIANLDFFNYSVARLRSEIYEATTSSLDESLEYAPEVIDVLFDMFLRRIRDANN